MTEYIAAPCRGASQCHDDTGSRGNGSLVASHDLWREDVFVIIHHPSRRRRRGVIDGGMTSRGRDCLEKGTRLVRQQPGSRLRHPTGTWVVPEPRSFLLPLERNHRPGWPQYHNNGSADLHVNQGGSNGSVGKKTT